MYTQVMTSHVHFSFCKLTSDIHTYPQDSIRMFIFRIGRLPLSIHQYSLKYRGTYLGQSTVITAINNIILSSLKKGSN